MATFDDNSEPAPSATPDPWSDDDLSAATQFYQNYIASHGIQTWGDASDGVRAYQAARRGGADHNTALTRALTDLGWDKAPDPTTHTNNPGPGGGPPPQDRLFFDDPNGPLFHPFPEPPPTNKTAPTPAPAPTFTPPTFSAPTFTPPPKFSYRDFQAPDPFHAPTLDDLYADPGYTFQRDEGLKAITNQKSAEGLLRSTGTLKDLSAWNQNFANTSYKDVYNRRANEYDRTFNNLFNEWESGYKHAADTYSTNYGVDRDTFATNYGVTRDTFDRGFQGAVAQFAPKLHEWDTTTSLNQRNSELDWERDFQKYLQNYKIWDDQRRFKYGVLDNERNRGLATY